MIKQCKILICYSSEVVLVLSLSLVLFGTVESLKSSSSYPLSLLTSLKEPILFSSFLNLKGEDNFSIVWKLLPQTIQLELDNSLYSAS